MTIGLQDVRTRLRGIARFSGAAPAWRSPPAPVPPGVTLEELEATFRTWSVNGAPPGALDLYIDDSLYRFLHTWGLVRETSGRCLELGANPYFTTHLLAEYTSLDLSLANFYSERGEATESVSFLPPAGSQRRETLHRCRMFNVEEDEFPYEDGSFDVVLFCEIIEHLLRDPMAALRQIHRVLRPGGTVIVTTPNVNRYANVLAMVRGGNIYDPYSGYGLYGRHNREYNRHELHRLLEFCGFEVEGSFTADGHDWDLAAWPQWGGVAELVAFRGEDLGQYLFVRARTARPPRQERPSFLYRSWDDGSIVEYV